MKKVTYSVLAAIPLRCFFCAVILLLIPSFVQSAQFIASSELINKLSLNGYTHSSIPHNIELLSGRDNPFTGKHQSGETLSDSIQIVDAVILDPVKIELLQQTINTESNESLLFDNGPFITLPGGGCAGGDASILDNSAGGPGHTLIGWGFQQNLGNWIADDFTNLVTWNLDSIKFYAYQTGAAGSTITGGYIQIWNGAPNAGGTVVWGDLTTNRMIRTGLTNIYRALITTPTNCDRRLQEVVCDVNASLPPGNYWVQIAATGSAASGPWCLPVTITGQAVTGNALQLTSTGWAPALNGPHQNGAPFLVYGTTGAPVGPGPATDPNPANGATGVSAPNATLSWTNPAGATSNNVFFGTAPGSLTQIHTGSLISSIPVFNLNYATNYYWRVDEIDGTGTTTGSTWSFTTMADPNVFWWCDGFNNLSNWTILGPLGLTNWTANNSNFAGGIAPPELRMSWTPSFNGESRIRTNVLVFSPPLPNQTIVNYSFRFFLDWYDNPSGTTQVLITWDGGTTTTPLYTLVDPIGDVGPLIVSGNFLTPPSGPVNLQVEILYSGNSFNIDFIYFDDLCFWPSWAPYIYAPSNLIALGEWNNRPEVHLTWQDNSYNEAGFRIFRKFGDSLSTNTYAIIGTTPENSTSFIDTTVLTNTLYTYKVQAFIPPIPYVSGFSNQAEVLTPVPVELTSFSAAIIERDVLLSWITATETNNYGFEIQKRKSLVTTPQVENSSRESEWERIGYVPGYGTTTEPQEYSFTHKNVKPGSYDYRLKQIDYDGRYEYSNIIEVEVPLPTEFILEQNYPNPFNPVTVISWQSPVSSYQTIKVFDILGREVETLVNEYREAGFHSIELDAKELSSGIYFYRLQSDDKILTKKMILSK